MTTPQPGILAPLPPAARYLTFTSGAAGLVPQEARATLAQLGASCDGEDTVIGLGASLVHALGQEVPGLVTHPCYARAGLEVPSTPAPLWCWLRGTDRGELVHRALALEEQLAPVFSLRQSIDAFTYAGGLDLTGYQDGLENPRAEAASAAAIATGLGPGVDGSSFVAVQQWSHDLARFASFAPREQDLIIGRRKADGQELLDAPLSAHVKRTAQESFSPEAFVLRRSMPWAGEHDAGLVFVAFGHSFAAYGAQLRRMVGAEDGIVDALFRFARPLTGAYFWCPPVAQGALDLSALDL